ncbi:MAG: adenylyl-sulfate kinase [Chloroflexi bacterium]|nr:adenylyl-sulfate kinase [Chloroflexota bacterium]
MGSSYSASSTGQTDILRFMLAGSVDDGKSTLIGRLLHDTGAVYEDHLDSLRRRAAQLGQAGPDLSLLTDGLRAEREQGITIDVAYRYFATPKRRFIVADAPGHEQYTRNMATAASTADVAVVLIDATRGVLTQSKRHAFIASLLGVPHQIVAVNKMDLVGYAEEVFERIRAEYLTFADRLECRHFTFVPVSALAGDNVVKPGVKMPWYSGPTLLSCLEQLDRGGLRDCLGLVDLRLPVQYVLRPSADFRGYAGTLASGIIRTGDEVLVLPGGRRTRVRRLIHDRRDVQYAFAPQAIAVCLEDEIDVGRGDMIVHPANLPWLAEELELIVVWMHEQPLRPGCEYLIKQTTNLVHARPSQIHYEIDPDTLRRRPAESLGLNAIGRMTCQLMRPLLCDEYSRNRQTGAVIFVDPIGNFTVGAGVIIDRSHRYRRPADEEPADLAPKSTPDRLGLRDRVGLDTPPQRLALLRQRACTIWLTGLSGAGKSTLASALEERLLAGGYSCVILDGDRLRSTLNRDLGFSPADRKENIRRTAGLARLFNEAGVTAIVALISPYREDRQLARQAIGCERFVEVYVDAPLDVCEARDPKGLYRRARAGDLPQFTGVSAPYEPPERPDVRIPTAEMPPDAALERLWAVLDKRGALLEHS